MTNIRFSWSSISTFITCKWKWYQNYVAKIDTIVDHRNFLAGAVVHKLVEDWAKLGFPENYLIDNVDTAYDAYISSHNVNFLSLAANTLTRESVADDKEFLLKKTRRAAERTEKLYRHFGFHEKPVLIENWLEFTVEDMNFVGIPDLYDYGRKAVFDLKVTENNSYGDLRQLAVYSIGLKTVKDLDTAALGFLYPLTKEGFVYREISLEALTALQNEVLEIAREMVKTEEYTKNYGKHCRWCQFNNTQHCTPNPVKDLPYSDNFGYVKMSR